MPRGPKPKSAGGKDTVQLEANRKMALIVLEEAEKSIKEHGSYNLDKDSGLIKRNPAVSDRLAALSLLTRIASAMGGGDEVETDEYERYLQEKQQLLFKGMQ